VLAIATWLILAQVNTEGDDPITAILNRDWAAVGGWSLFVGLCLLIVFGFMREIIVPGARYKRTHAALDKALDALKEYADQNGKLITANEITKYFFEETAPKRGGSRATMRDSDGGDPI
jgi:hypothetical protein